MKILHIGQRIGGLDVYISNTITYLDSDFEFVIACGKDDKCSPIIKNGKPIKEYKVRIYRELNLIKDLSGLVQLLRIVKKEKPDIIHCHSAKGGVLGRIAGYVMRIRTFYTPHAFSFLSTSSALKKKVYIILERMVKFNSNLLACSESERELGIKVVHYKESNTYVWNNAVPDVSKTLGDDKDEQFIYYIGRPSYQKNVDFFTDIVKDVHEVHPEIKFKLLGLGYFSPALKQLQKQINDYGLTDVIELVSWLNQETVLEQIKNSMFYLTVSRYEGLPLAVIEAMSLGKAIVASDAPGNRDCVANGYNGYLLPLEKDMFVKSVCELIEDEGKRKMYGNNSRTLFERKFLITERIKELKTIYQSAKA